MAEALATAAGAPAVPPGAAGASGSPAASLAGSFLPQLVRVWRAQDTHGSWDRRSDAELLAPYVLSREQRRALPIVGDPDPDTLWRLELFHNAVGLAIEQLTGRMVAPLMKLHHEGFGRVVLTAGRLVVVNRHLRDVHRFGFESLEALGTEGDKLVEQGVRMIERFPEVADD